MSTFPMHIFQARLAIAKAMEEISSASFVKHGHDQLIIATMTYLRTADARLKKILEEDQ